MGRDKISIGCIQGGKKIHIIKHTEDGKRLLCRKFKKPKEIFESDTLNWSDVDCWDCSWMAAICYEWTGIKRKP